MILYFTKKQDVTFKNQCTYFYTINLTTVTKRSRFIVNIRINTLTYCTYYYLI